MKIDFFSSVIFVKDIEISKRFYLDIMDMKIDMDFGRCVQFLNGLALWDKEIAHQSIYKSKNINEIENSALELFFDTDDIDAAAEKLKAKNIEVIHSPQEEPWGQKTMRFFDPDKNVIEIGETMDVMVKRMHSSGLSLYKIKKKTGLPEDFIENIIAGI